MSVKRRAVISLEEERLDVAALIDGSVEELPPMTSQAVRVFISSTFSDMCAERNALMEMAYPELKEYCRQNNLEFQAYDLRWGIRDHSMDDHSIVEFCLKEIMNCQSHSVGPSLVAFIGQKYGFRPLPPTMLSEEFSVLLEELKFEHSDEVPLDDVELLMTWYNVDTNIHPHLHRLQPISSIIKNFKSQDALEREDATKEWENISKKLLGLLRLAADSCLENLKFTQAQRDKFFVSVTELELELGIFKNSSPGNSCLCFFRTIKDLESNINNRSIASRYVDLTPRGNIDDEAQKLLHDLKHKKIPAALPFPANYQSFEIEWSDKSSDPNNRADYLKCFSQAFVKKMKGLIDKSICLTRMVTYDVNMLDIIQHVYTAQSKGKDCRGRTEVLNKIRAYLKGRPSGQPLVIHGESGCGKSALIAKAFLECQTWFPIENGINPVVIVRFFGTTSLSCDIRLALSCICWQISMAYSGGMIGIPGDYTKLVVHFSNMLKLATKKRPLVLLLDSLDQLCASHRAHSLAWLPNSSNVYILLTTQNDHNIFSSLIQRFPAKQNFVGIPSFESRISVEIVKDWLAANNRSLTPDQFEVVQKAFINNPVPLYTVLVCREVGRWTSYLDDFQLASSCHAIIIALFERTEKYYGFILVKHMLSYITASKNGLSGMELEDILSLDDVVLGDVFQHWVPPILRIPPLLVCRIRDELSNYLVEREANGTPVIYWYHNQFLKVATERYLSDSIFSRYVHSLMGHYFLGTWSAGRKKPLDTVVLANAFEEQKLSLDARSKVLQKDADRMVARQPLRYDMSINSPNTVCDSYNLRKLVELPHHLIRAKMFFYLRNHVLFNYDWIHAKMVATSLHDILADYQEAAEAETFFNEDPELQLLRSALRIGGVKLNEHPDSLGFELLGRLMNYYDGYNKLPLIKDSSISSSVVSDFPPSPDCNRKLGDSSALDYGSVLNTQFSLLESANDLNKRRVKTFKHSDLLSLLQQCDNRSIFHSSLLPVHQCFEPPDMMLLHVLDGHSGQPSGVVYLPTTSEIVTVSKKEILFWDLNSCGTMTRRIVIPDFADIRPGSAGSRSMSSMGINNIFVNRSHTKLVLTNTIVDTPALVYDIRTGTLERKCGSKQANSSRTFLAGDFVFCQQNLFLDIRTGKPLAEMSNFVKTKNFASCAMSQDSSILVIGEENNLKVFEFLSQKLICHTQLKSVPSIVAVDHNNTTIHVGFTKTCQLNVYNMVKSKWSAHLKLQLVFNFKKKLPASEVEKHKNVTVNEITDVVLPPEQLNAEDDIRGELINQILLNISKVTLVLVSKLDDDKWVLMNTNFSRRIVRSQKQLPPEKISFKSQMEFLIGKPAFSGNGEFILAGIGNQLCVWSRETGEVLRSVPFHSDSKFCLITAEKHLAITTSTLNGAVRVWDLRAAKLPPTCSVNFSANCGPARMICCARDSLLAFVGNSYSAVNVLGIRQPDYFGIDVLNLLNGTRHTLLSYGKYGRLLKMKVSPDGRFLALLLATINQNAHYVVVIEVMGSGDLVAFAQHKLCRTFETSPNWSWLATEAPTCSSSEIIIWKLRESDDRDHHMSGSTKNLTTEEYRRFEDATCPQFLLDGKRVAFISTAELSRSVQIFILPKLDLCANIGEGNIVDVKVLPGLRNCLLLRTSIEPFDSVISIWNISSSSKVTADFVTNKRGIIDVSKDGKLALDSELNVYDLTSNGDLISSFKNTAAESKKSIRISLNADFTGIETAKLTYDGRFVLWTDQNQLKAGRVHDGSIVGTAYLHEKLSCLEVVDFGYMQVVGGENGHIFVVRLIATNPESNDMQLATAYNPKNLKDRQNYLIDRQISLKNSENEKCWKTIDAYYGGGSEEENHLNNCSLKSKLFGEEKCNKKSNRYSLLSDVEQDYKISQATMEKLKAKANIPLTELGGFVKNLQTSSPLEFKGSIFNLSESGHMSRSRIPPKYKTINDKPKRTKIFSSVPPRKFHTLDYLVASTLNTHSPLSNFSKS